jgi:hypothetical protein
LISEPKQAFGSSPSLPGSEEPYSLISGPFWLPSLCQTGKMLNCLSFYLDGEMYTFLYPLDARHPDPPQLGPSDSPRRFSILIGQIPNRAIGCLASSRLTASDAGMDFSRSLAGHGLRYMWGSTPICPSPSLPYSPSLCKFMSESHGIPGIPLMNLTDCEYSFYPFGLGD